ncbi:hypothetical protein Tco_1211264 [Tanacetum coccineum]
MDVRCLARSHPAYLKGMQDFLIFADQVNSGDAVHMLARHGELLVDNSTSVRISIDNENGDSYIYDDYKNSDEMSNNVEDTIGPKQPGNDIDVYLAPLIDDLKTLWDKGVKVYDAYKKENFTLRAMIFCTISDFPAYDNLSGYSTKGYVRNWVRPEGSIVTRYLAEELIEFDNDVVKGVDNIGIPYSRHKGRLAGVGTIGLSMTDPNRDALKIEKSTMQNSGVTLIASTIEFDRSNHDAMAAIAKKSFDGVIQEI